MDNNVGFTGVERIWHIRQSRPDSGLDFETKVIKTFRVVPSSLGSGFSQRLLERKGDELVLGGDAILEYNDVYKGTLQGYLAHKKQRPPRTIQ